LDYWLILAVWTVPFLTVPLGMADIPGSCLPIAALGARLVWHWAGSVGERLTQDLKRKFGSLPDTLRSNR